MPTSIKRHKIDQSPLFKLNRRKKLADLLKISSEQLRWLSKYSDGLYRERDAPKRNGIGTRHIEDPHKLLKQTQSRLAVILSRIDPPDYLFCPVKGRDYIKNAAQHRGNRIVRCLDIRKYFPSTPAFRVFRFFNEVMKCNRDLAATLTKLACYKEHLPTGSPLSPILSYFAHIDVWSAVSEICRAHGYTLTVYIDDVTVSGANLSGAVMWEIKKAIHRSGLRYHKEKHYVDRPAEITGVIVDGDIVMPPHRQHKKIRENEENLKLGLKPAEAKKIEGKLVGLRGQLRQIQLEAKKVGP
jgi:hypothetical protein